MKKHFLLSLLILCIINNNLQAGTVSVSDAQRVAVNFYKINTPASATVPSATLKYTKTGAGSTADFYVFDMSPMAGFVIVAADDNVIPILGYSTTGIFRTDFGHVGVNHWVNRTSANIRLALQNKVVADARISSQWSAYRQGLDPFSSRSGTVSPLSTTTWDQENDVSNTPPFLYNLFCPYYAADSQRALTGCEATAMAQIMKYWNYPANGTGSYTYTDDVASGYSFNYGTLSSSFTHAYQWSSMPNVLTGSETVTQDTAVARLMYDCAVSIGMDFGDDNQGGSASNALISYELQTVGDSICVQYALVKYFGYDPDTINGVYESAYTASGWTAVIEHELNMGRLVLYEGDDTVQGGHAWVCDGYDASDKFHMNWGWGGSDNGYFAVNNLTTTGNFNPNQDEDALIGIMPKHSHSTGVTEVNNAIAFNVFPNPAANEVVLQTNELNAGAIWSIRDIVGQTVLSRNADAAQTHIDISGLTAGVYLVELHIGDRSSVKKLVVSK